MAVIRSLKDHDSPFVSTRELADYLNLKPRFIQSEIEKGALPARKFGRVYRILLTDAQAYVGSTGLDPRYERHSPKKQPRF